jgi:tetratricopeptide (TPR) repeat protein
MEDVAQSEALLERLLPHDAQISPLAVYPGTRLHRELLAAGAVPPDFYRARGELEIWARPDNKRPGGHDAFTAKALARLRRAADAAAARARYTPEDFRGHRKLLGWCCATNVICGEAAEEAGDAEEAIRQYAEITAKEPHNPWGWLRRGRARLGLGRFPAAAADFGEALKIMPNGLDALEGLEAARRGRRA